jgi:uncharacterized protein YoxC
MKKKPIKSDTGKYVTEKSFEAHMRSVANSFERQSKVMELMLSELQVIRETGVKTEKTVNSFTHDVGIHDRRIENILSRVEKLETKFK